MQANFHLSPKNNKNNINLPKINLFSNLDLILCQNPDMYSASLCRSQRTDTNLV